MWTLREVTASNGSQVKHDVKATLTVQANGSSGGEGARTHIQGKLSRTSQFASRALKGYAVFANSGVASVLSLLHTYQIHQRERGLLSAPGSIPSCYTWVDDVLALGIVANYAAVAADTFSSELGILSKSRPRLITSWNLRQVPPGTNGGVTVWGIVAGLLGSLIIVVAAVILIPFCPESSSVMGQPEAWAFLQRLRFVFIMTLWGALGSILDSFLGGWFQPSVVDTRSGKIVEGRGGEHVLVSSPSPQRTTKTRLAGKQSAGDEPSRRLESGSLGLLDNNQVNFLMALIMSVGAITLSSTLRV